MKTTDNITVTNGRLKKALHDKVTPMIMPKINRQINETAQQERIRTGIIVKFYPYLDKALISLDNSNENVLCKILHRFGGGLIDLYTPPADRLDVCDDLHEPCYYPRGDIHCLLANIHDSDSEEYLLLGFYENEELVGLNPASPGNIKITSIGGTNQFWIKFGDDGLDLRLPNTITINVGDMDADMNNIEYADSNNTYTKEEIDKMIEDLRNELTGEDNDLES